MSSGPVYPNNYIHFFIPGIRCVCLALVDTILDIKGICATEEAGGVWAGHPMLSGVSLAS